MAVVPDAGEPLSPQAADLIRQIAQVFLDEPADLMAEVHAAVLAAADEPLRSEPVLAAEVAASTRANVLHLAASMLEDPGGPVPASLTPEVLGIAREAFRRGIEQSVYTTYHTGQNIIWAYWMRTAFSLSVHHDSGGLTRGRCRAIPRAVGLQIRRDRIGRPRKHLRCWHGKAGQRPQNVATRDRRRSRVDRQRHINWPDHHRGHPAGLRGLRHGGAAGRR